MDFSFLSGDFIEEESYHKCSIEFMDEDIDLTFDAKEAESSGKSMEQCIEIINDNLSQLEDNWEGCTEYICDALLETKNEAWLDDDDFDDEYDEDLDDDEDGAYDDDDSSPNALTPDEFISELKGVGRIHVWGDLSMTLYFRDSDLFWGHIISVDVDTDGGFSQAMFQG